MVTDIVRATVAFTPGFTVTTVSGFAVSDATEGIYGASTPGATQALARGDRYEH